MHSHNFTSATAKEMDIEDKMNLASMRGQAAALAAKFKVKCPRLEVLRDIFDDIDGDVGPKCLRAERIHETGLMEQVVKLALV
jgi:uncharacterized protein (UPF0264 family)